MALKIVLDTRGQRRRPVGTGAMLEVVSPAP